MKKDPWGIFSIFKKERKSIMTQENQTHVKDTAKNVMARNNPLAQGRQLALWIEPSSLVPFSAG